MCSPDCRKVLVLNRLHHSIDVHHGTTLTTCSTAPFANAPEENCTTSAAFPPVVMAKSSLDSEVRSCGTFEGMIFHHLPSDFDAVFHETFSRAHWSHLQHFRRDELHHIHRHISTFRSEHTRKCMLASLSQHPEERFTSHPQKKKKNVQESLTPRTLLWQGISLICFCVHYCTTILG